MSNHEGGRMLSKVLHLFAQDGVFEQAGLERSQALVKKAVAIAAGYDCNSGEILEDLETTLQMCYCCLQPCATTRAGLCPSCSD